EDMGEAYPELKAQQTIIENVIREEEMAFLRTLDRGIKLMDEYMAKNADSKIISGTDAFSLYDTFGFPIDLTCLIAGENGYSVDMEGFKIELEKQKERARNAASSTFGDWTVYHEGDSVEFTGHDETVHKGALLLKSRSVEEKKKSMIQLVFDVTPFYGEMGGEVGDTGAIISADGERIPILNTIKENELTIHVAEKLPANCEGAFTLEVDAERRQKVANNHSCTHLLNKALIEVLGGHVEQKGSYVCENYFRFDFSHFEKLSREQITAVESRVNQLIRRNFPLVEKRDVTMEEANEMGAIALFGEKYGERVRVVNFGPSTELCGGCHTSATGNIGLFKINSESAIAAGIRRIEAVTGEEAEALVNELQNTIRSIRSMLNNAADVSAAISKMIEDNDSYKKQLAEAFKEKTLQYKNELLSKSVTINGHNVIKLTEAPDFTMLRDAATMLQREAENLVITAALELEGKAQLLLMYSHDLVVAGKNAGADIREAAKYIQGGGGGQPGLAMAGGKNVAGLGEAMQKLLEKI
ncbi:MAG: alanine--tRNA ligase, partial [Rikenellaceae bacterium]|nr:alanine--tRNA ligase [Rikenellaceae bacterium]